MDVNTISTLISSVGFPIAAAAYMAYLNRKQSEDFNRSLAQLSEKHESEVEALREVVNNNTIVLERLTEVMRNANITPSN